MLLVTGNRAETTVVVVVVVVRAVNSKVQMGFGVLGDQFRLREEQSGLVTNKGSGNSGEEAGVWSLVLSCGAKCLVI